MEQEDKSEKFIRIADRRTNNVLQNLRLLSNLRNASIYESTQAQRDKILKAIREAVTELEYVWAGEKLNKSKFTLND